MEAYTRVDKKRDDAPTLPNEVRVMASSQMRNYISYAITLLEEKGHESVVLKAMGRAINKTVSIAEILKRRVAGLHQITEVGSVDITDVWEPREEGLNRLEITRHVSRITITLSTKQLDETHPGYQSPLPADQVQHIDSEELEDRDYSRDRRRGGRGRGRGGRGRGGRTGGGGAAAEADGEGNVGGVDAGGNSTQETGYEGGSERRGRGRGRVRGQGRRSGRRSFVEGEEGQQQHEEGQEGGGAQGSVEGRQGGEGGLRGRGRGARRGRGGRGRRGRGAGGEDGAEVVGGGLDGGGGAAAVAGPEV